ncbi:hypothetical protein ACSQ67_022488 [Phaseolus vulgaris]
MEGFFCEKLLGILVLEVEELFWDKLLKRGEFEEELLVEQLLENNDLVDDVLAWLLQPASFFDTFHFSSIKNQATVYLELAMTGSVRTVLAGLEFGKGKCVLLVDTVVLGLMQETLSLRIASSNMHLFFPLGDKPLVWF